MDSLARSQFKIVLIGDGATGKSAFVKRHLEGEYEKKYTPTLGVSVATINFTTNYGIIKFDVWDTAGQEIYSGLKDGYYINADGALLFFDVSSPETLKNVPTWRSAFSRLNPDSPIILCGAKSDGLNKIKKELLNKVKERMPYFLFSSLSCINIEQPLLDLARKLTGCADLIFI